MALVLQGFNWLRENFPSRSRRGAATRAITVSLFAITSFTAALMAGAPAKAATRAVQADPPGITETHFTAYVDIRDYLARNDIEGALTALQGVTEKYENDPAFFDLVGLLAMKSRNYATAAAAFERVVLMQPDNAGAWMDLAIASVESGNPQVALGYFDHIEAEFSPSPSLLAVIASYRKRIATPAVSPYGWRFRAESTLGHDSNANSGLRDSNIPLTLEGDLVNLPLDESFRPRADDFVTAAAGASYKRPTDLGMFELNAGVRQRSYRREHEFSTTEINFGSALQKSFALGDASLAVHLSHLNLGGNSLLRTTRTVLYFERQNGTCRAGGGVEAEWRRYYSLANLDANLAWGQLGLACDREFGKVPFQGTLLARAGIDRPNADRPGGVTRHRELIGQVGAPLAWGLYGEVSYTMARANDDQGYSALLEQNAARRLDRRTSRLSLSYPVGKHSAFTFIAEDNRVNSNLALFRQRGQSLSLGIRSAF